MIQGDEADRASKLVLGLQRDGVAAADAWKALAQALGGFTGTVSPDPAALEVNIARAQEFVDHVARAYFAEKQRQAGERRRVA